MCDLSYDYGCPVVTSCSRFWRVGTDAPVLMQDGGGKRSIHTMRWGLVPAFTKKEAKPGIIGLDLLRKFLYLH